MARRQGTLSLSSNIEPRMAAPLDARDIVPLKADLTTNGTFPYSYVGMKVVALDVNKLFILIGEDTTVEANWKEVGEDTSVELTQAQYDALPSSKETDGIKYYIKDAAGGGGGSIRKRVNSTVSGSTLVFTDTSIDSTSVIEGPYILNGYSAISAAVYDSTNHTITYTLADDTASGKSACIYVS